MAYSGVMVVGKGVTLPLLYIRRRRRKLTRPTAAAAARDLTVKQPSVQEGALSLYV